METTFEAVANESNEPAEPIFCDEVYPNRVYFTIVGTVIAVIGCLSNLVLLFVFLTRRRSSWSLYLTFLALLDFLLCFIYVTSFGLLTFSISYRIRPIYDLLKEIEVHQYSLSRIVQVCIPYVLIASSAEKLGDIGGFPNFGRGYGSSVCVCGFIAILWTALRVPGFYAITVAELPGCDYFESKSLVRTELADDEMYKTFDIVVSFFHLFVSFIVLFLLNGLIVHRLRISHRNARRHSSCPTVVLSTTKQVAITDEKKEHKRLRCAIKTTTVVLSSYLACNSVNFILYTFEVFIVDFIKENDWDFSFAYIAFSDIGTILFVLSSAIRLFIYYKYNPDVKAALKTIDVCGLNKASKTTYEAAASSLPQDLSHVQPSNV